MKRIPRVLAAVAAVGLFSVVASAQPAWERVQALRPNQAVTVYPRTGEPVKGKLQSAGADSLTLLGRGGKTVRVGRDDVLSVTRRSRLNGAMWGGILGFGVGFPVGAFAGPYLTDYGNPSTGVRLRHGAALGLLVGGIGAGIGALTGTETTVYRAAKPTGSSPAR
ncbi:MAG: hypothetical protein NT090_26150 [Acidobacteria bacterium]|nr:hypothetical protein [Acidobacteriota bacterium]